MLLGKLTGAEYLLAECSPEDVFSPEDFSPEQKQLAETIDQFVSKDILPNVEKLEHQDFGLMINLLRKCGELGLLMIEAPEEYGGLDLDKATAMLVAEKISRYASFTAAYMVQTGIGMLPLVYYGTRAQNEKYLGKLISGEWISAYCLTEPGSGSDAMGAKTTATLSADGKHYILNGTKQFITNGGFADLYTVFAKVDRKQFTAFLVERSFDGISPGPEEKKLGIKGSSTTQVILEDAKVPVENVLGEIGKGHKIAFNVLNVGRFKLGAVVTGTAKIALVEGLKYANLRKQFGVSIGTFGAIREKIADMTAAIFASESLVYRLAGMIDDRLETIPKGRTDYFDSYQKGIEEYAVECAIAKVFCSEVLAKVVDDVVQIHGGYGFIQEYPAERFYRDERVNRIFEGTNEINRILIAGNLFRRAEKGEIPLSREAGRALEYLSGSKEDAGDASGLLAAERKLLRNLKRVFLSIAGTASEKLKGQLKDEQEILMTLADIAINIFALDSSVLRAGKVMETLDGSRRDCLGAVIKVISWNAAEAVALSARKSAFFLGEPELLLGGIQRLTRYDAAGLLQAKRQLAESSLESEKYVFEV
ncbi:MAG: acyl-CoA dehydrogenase family protein [bacterium]|jgi:alkylation response protein AidB-like acyl-CoA dehydrogenase